MRCLAACLRKVNIALMMCGVAGCAPEARRLARTFPHPGPAAYQRDEAIKHDPYLLDDVGPEVVGARPREYQRPLNEVERARLAASPPPGMQMAPTPGLPAAPPPGPVQIGPYPGAPAPVVPAPQPTPFPYQQRAPY